MIKVLHNDCDGVLVDSEGQAFPVAYALTREVFRARGNRLPYTVEEFREKYEGTNFHGIMTELSNEFGLHLTAVELDELVAKEQQRVTEHLGKVVQAPPGTHKALERLQEMGIHLTVVSSSALPRVQVCLKAAGLDHFFKPDEVFSAMSLEPPKPKPAPDVYLKAQGHIPYADTESAAIEDSLNGCRSARDAGLLVIGYVATIPTVRRKHRAQKLLAAGAIGVTEQWALVPELISLHNSGRSEEVANRFGWEAWNGEE